MSHYPHRKHALSLTLAVMSAFVIIGMMWISPQVSYNGLERRLTEVRDQKAAEKKAAEYKKELKKIIANGKYSQDASVFIESDEGVIPSITPAAKTTKNVQDCQKSGGVWNSGCVCTQSCDPDRNAFGEFDLAGMGALPQPTRSPEQAGYLTIADEMSSCSFMALQKNVCGQCQVDNDCGGYDAEQSSDWLRTRTKAVCIEGACKYRRVIYSEYE